MITYLQIAVDHETGEAWFTTGSVRKIQTWAQESVVFGADIAKDILQEAESLYCDIMDQWAAQSTIGKSRQ